MNWQWAVENWSGRKQQLALIALSKLKREWGFQPVDLIPAGHGIVEIDAAHLTAAGILPPEERNDSFIIAEAALLNCTLLISSDSHLTAVDPLRLREALIEKDLTVVLLKSPREIVKTFGGNIIV